MQHISNSLTQLNVVVTKGDNIFIICKHCIKKKLHVYFVRAARLITVQELRGSDVTGRHTGWVTHLSSQRDEVMLFSHISSCLSVPHS